MVIVANKLFLFCCLRFIGGPTTSSQVWKMNGLAMHTLRKKVTLSFLPGVDDRIYDCVRASPRHCVSFVIVVNRSGSDSGEDLDVDELTRLADFAHYFEATSGPRLPCPLRTAHNK